MRKTIALKSLLRDPLKSLLTFLLIAAASFSLCSRVTDYAVTNRETAKAESFYHGVAALDNSAQPIGMYWPDPKPWPSAGQLEKFSSLPGVTLTDTRYATDGLIEDYKRVIDTETYMEEGEFLLEGTFDGIEEYDSGALYLLFKDVTVYAGEIKFDTDRPLKIKSENDEDFSSFWSDPYPRSFYDKLNKGSRCLVLGTYSEQSGTAFVLGTYRQYWDEQMEVLRVIDGLGEDYLETEEFAWYKDKIAATNQSTSAYDIVYTSDMRAIPYVNERRIVIGEGRPLTAGDTDACVVSEVFLETYGLSLGDKVHIELGDRLFRGNGFGGTRYREAKDMSKFVAAADLEIIGAYKFTDEGNDRESASYWSYGPAAVFVPASLLPVEVPKDYEMNMGDFSVFIENPHDIEAFLEDAEPLAAEMGLGLRFSEGGWTGIEDNIETGSLASFLTTVLYVLGAVLALFLALYLYIDRNKKTYAIMRTLGVPGRKADITILLPLGILSVSAISVGGAAGLFYASHTAAKALAAISDSSAPSGYVYILDATIPAGTAVFCLCLELVFIAVITQMFLQKMKKISPLELLQEGMEGTARRAGVLREPLGSVKQPMDVADCVFVPGVLDSTKLSAALAQEVPADAKPGRRPAPGYGPLRQVSAYILRHMRRGVGKTAISLALTLVLASGIGSFVLARLSYQDMRQEVKVSGKALDFAAAQIEKLSESDLIEGFFCYSSTSVRVNDKDFHSPMIVTNDPARYLGDGYAVDYEEGYDLSNLDGTGAVCLMGRELAEDLGVRPGDEISLLSDDMYSVICQVYTEGDKQDLLENAVARENAAYRVIGIIESGNENISAGIVAGINSPMENVCGGSVVFGYSEFTLADNERLHEFTNFLEEQKIESMQTFAPMAFFHIDAQAYKDVRRIHNLLESLFGVAIAAAVLIGVFGPGIVILQSAKETALLRILGVTKKRARCMLVIEQIVLCIAGVALVAAGLALFRPGMFARSTQTLVLCWTLYFLGCLCGALAAAVQVTKHKVLEPL